MAPTMAEEKPGGSGHNAAVVARLRAMRGRGESHTEVILRLVEQEAHMRAVAWLVSVGALLAPSMPTVSGETLYCRADCAQ